MEMNIARMQTIEAKVVVLGTTGVGKTSVVTKYVRGEFGYTTSTIGAAFMRKDVIVENEFLVQLAIWDTAGQERFRSMTPMYYRNSKSAILIYDVSAADSFQHVVRWVEELQQHAAKDLVMVLVGNKCDLRTPQNADVCISSQQGQEYATKIGAKFVETSAKTGKDISLIFEWISADLVRQLRSHKEEESVDKIRLNDSSAAAKKGCC